MYINILILILVAFQHEYIKHYNYFKKIIRSKKIRVFNFCFQLTSLINFIYITYIINKLLGLSSDFNNIFFSVLLPNIITMSLFYWIFIAPKISNKVNFSYSSCLLHFITGIFVLLEYFDSKDKFTPSYLLNSIFVFFFIIIVYLNKYFTNQWYYDIVDLYKPIGYYYVLAYLVSIIVVTYLLDRFRLTSFN